MVVNTAAPLRGAQNAGKRNGVIVMMDKESEKRRFNELTQEQAAAIAASLKTKSVMFRSCWNCNGAHEHLKNAGNYFLCFGCDIMYADGFPLKIIGMRSRGAEVTDMVMDEYESALQER